MIAKLLTSFFNKSMQFHTVESNIKYTSTVINLFIINEREQIDHIQVQLKHYTKLTPLLKFHYYLRLKYHPYSYGLQIFIGNSHKLK